MKTYAVTFSKEFTVNIKAADDDALHLALTKAREYAIEDMSGGEAWRVVDQKTLGPGARFIHGVVDGPDIVHPDDVRGGR